MLQVKLIIHIKLAVFVTEKSRIFLPALSDLSEKALLSSRYQVVRAAKVHEALIYLKTNNAYFLNINVSESRLAKLPSHSVISI